MAGCYPSAKPPPLAAHSKRVQGIRCSFSTTDKKYGNNVNKREIKTRSKTPQILKLTVRGVTELLRLFSSSKNRLETVSDTKAEEISVSDVDDVVMILKCDYENAYFVTGAFTSSIYAEDCMFEDPTIRFRGRELYSRNLKLLVPFFDGPSIGLQKIEKDISSDPNFVLATWKLRTYLKLPWKPFIYIDGSTLYELDDEFNIVRHAESWNISALEAIGQIFTPSFGRPED